MATVITQTNKLGRFIKGSTPWNKGVKLTVIFWEGKKHSEESKKKMSESAKGRVPWNKGKKGMQKSWNKGTHPEYLQGENHYNWKGGKGNERHKLMNQFEYINWRSSVFERDLYTCQKCNKKGCYLTAHHIKSWAKCPELRYVIENGITLCSGCHSDVDKFYARLHKRRIKK